MAEHLAELGARVVLMARRVERLEELADRIGKDGGSAVVAAVDVTDGAAVQEVADRVDGECGGADLVFNNAGISVAGPFEQLDMEQCQRQIDVNVTGMMNVITAFTGQLVRAAQERGVADLVNTSSIAAQNIYPNFAVYASSKAYITHMSRHLRAELGGKGVRVSAVEPGMVGTELQSHVTDEGVLQWLEASKETMEWLTPPDVARTVGFLAALPPRVNLQQVTIMPTRQAS